MLFLLFCNLFYIKFKVDESRSIRQLTFELHNWTRLVWRSLRIENKDQNQTLISKLSYQGWQMFMIHYIVFFMFWNLSIRHPNRAIVLCWLFILEKSFKLSLTFFTCFTFCLFLLLGLKDSSDLFRGLIKKWKEEKIHGRYELFSKGLFIVESLIFGQE